MNRSCKLGLFLLFSMVLTLGLVGCSNESSSDGKDSDEKVEITLGYYSSGSADEKMEELIDQFEEKHPNIKVKTQNAPYSQFFQKLDTQIAGNNAPDVWLSDGVLVSKYAERGAAKDVSEWIERDLNKDEYYGLDFNKDANGKYFAVPQGIQIGALFYNKDMFDEAGVDYPDDDWSWEDLQEAAAKLTIDAEGNRATDSKFNEDAVNQYGMTFFNITEGWMPVLKSFGGGVLDEELKNSVIDSPENEEAVKWMVEGMEKGILTDPSDLQSFQSPMSPFPSGTAAMRIGIYARVLAANETGINYDVSVLPKGPDGKRFAPVIANSWIVNNNSSDAKAEAAWEWVKFWVTEDDVQKEWAELGEAVPVKKSVANSDLFLNSGENKINKQAFLDSFEFAGTLDTNAVWSEWLQKFNDNINRAFLNETSVEEALKQADKEVTKVLEDFYKK
ncbi:MULTISPECIES: ABC transporter substrate-binding protein [Pontibacillus]|uniref:Sugar ABC transporter substrate-binding protein n=1 Tax=Pontibacillus chungwhensis TaxID=265426 RepID=A0ABY8USQ4_9BACI|nr:MULTISPECIES: sugar ABC transporter substrate-binding protein [Pontibacillus]MCD5322840.1 sugar ABC transporter substrate-binding protein [Pontibacillus sp. HN14]WIF96238.1 sugar ABC transporter substrate-binding protein [Pontibacillus chungwhensis]